MADPLTLLREFTKNKKSVQLENDQFNFDGILFPRNADTAFRTKNRQEPYTLDAVWFALKHADVKHTEYLQECTKQGFPLVSLVDKKVLISYLTGEIDTCANINPAQLSAASIPLPQQKREADGETDYNDNKRLKVDGESSRRSDSRNDDLAPMDLGSGLSAEQIKELKMKRLNKKTSEGSNRSDDANKYKYEMDPITKEIVGKEKNLRTRTSVLQTTKKNFVDIINAVNSSIKQAEEQKKAEKARPRSGAPGSYDRYGDVQESRFWKDKLKGNETEEFQIDTRGTFADAGKIASSSSSSSTAAPRSNTPKAPAKSPVANSSTPKKFDKNAAPIIIVPGVLTSLMTTFNAKEFLEDGEFVSSVDKKNNGAKKESMVSIERKKVDPSSNLPVRYQVVDNPAKLESKDWGRVVAVFAVGAAWQFKSNWPFKSPNEIFNAIQGYYLRYEDEAVPELVKQWGLKVLTLSKQKAKQHLSQTAHATFWTTLDEFMQKKM